MHPPTARRCPRLGFWVIRCAGCTSIPLETAHKVGTWNDGLKPAWLQRAQVGPLSLCASHGPVSKWMMGGGQCERDRERQRRRDRDGETETERQRKEDSLESYLPKTRGTGGGCRC